jgi:hypothetical protein
MSHSITIYWDDTVIFHKNVEKTFSIGESKDVDFVLPLPGIEKFTLLDNDTLSIPPGYFASVNGETISSGNIDVKNNDIINVLNDKIRICVREVTENHSFPMFDWAETISSKLYVGMSFVFHVMLMCAFAFFMPPLGITDAEANTKDQLFLMQQYLKASAERENENKPEEATQDQGKDDKEGGTGTRAIGAEGSMGNPNSRQTNKSFAIAGPKDNKDIHIAREAALRDASTFGMIGLLNAGSNSDPNAPTAPWGRDESLGADPFSARGNMWGSEPGEAFGAGGLGLSGIGEGGGGRGEGIGLGSVGTIGHGAGLGDKQGFGNGHGLLGKGHKTKAPYGFRTGVTTVTGRLPAEVIQRIVRQNYGRFRACYENGLRSNPSLQGRVAVRFVIGRDGAVSNVSNGGSDLPEPSVVQCIIRAYYGLSFPEPEGGIVTVIYPIMFQAQ